MPTYTVTGRPIVVDDGFSTAVQVQNTGSNPLIVLPLGRQVIAGATVTVPGWSAAPTTVSAYAGTTTAVVTLTAGSPGLRPGPGAVTFDPGPSASMSVSISGGTWYTDEGLTSAVTFPRAISTVTSLYPAASASVVITATVGTVMRTRGMNVVDGCAETFAWEPTSATDVIATAIAAGSGGSGAAVQAPAAQFISPQAPGYGVWVPLGAVLGTLVCTAGTIYVTPVSFDSGFTLASITIQVSATGGTTGYVGIYSDSGGFPGTLLGVSSALTLSSVGRVTGTVSVPLTAATRYWVAFLPLTSACTVIAPSTFNIRLPWNDLSVADTVRSYVQSGQSSMPSTFTLNATANNCPAFILSR